MSRIPLFPLPVVLFPGAVMPLHIFEPRYRQMVADCLEGDRRFGLMHHDSDEQGPFLGEAGRVGTIAHITRHEPMDDGRSMILVRGEGRFSIREEHDLERLYYEASVMPYTDRGLPDTAAILRARDHTLRLFHTVLRTMHGPPDEVPGFDRQRDLSFQLAPMIQIDARWQQSFLELREEAYRLERLDAVFQAAVDRAAGDPASIDDDGPEPGGFDPGRAH
jgi:Lon protease-like protein